jgi:hypothetical protein
MNKTKLKQKFLDKLGICYCNFGSEWSIEEFLKDEMQKEFLLKYLNFLCEKGVISFNEEKSIFKILNLPSLYSDLI